MASRDEMGEDAYPEGEEQRGSGVNQFNSYILGFFS